MSNKRKKNEFIGDMVAADGGIQGYHRAIRRKWYVLGVLVIISLFMCLLSVNAGAASMSPFEVLKTLLGISGDERSFVVIWRLRMPRVVAAIVAGAGLSIAGCVMQTTLKNPLASPSTLGVSAGATFGANLAIIVLGAGTVMNTASDAVAINNPYLVTFCAFACAAGAVLLIMALSNLRGFTPESIVLAGTALSSLFSAGTTIIQYFGDDVKIAAALFWTFGDLGRVSWTEVAILAVITGAIIIYYMFMRWNYNAIDELQSKTGIPVVALSYGDTEVFDQSIYDSLTLIGQVTGHADRAAEVVAYMQNLATELAEITANVEDKPSVYLGCQSNRGSHGIESTIGNYILFDIMGTRNAAGEAGIPEYAMIDKEQIIEMDPDIIIIDAGGYDLLVEDYNANPEFYNSLRAFKEGKVYMQMPYNYYYTNLEIAMADTYYIGSVVYPELFADTDIQTKFAEISEFMLGMNCYDSIANDYYGGYQTVNLGD